MPKQKETLDESLDVCRVMLGRFDSVVGLWAMSCTTGRCAAGVGAQPGRRKTPCRDHKITIPAACTGRDDLNRSDAELEESVSRHDVVELLAVDPKFDWAKDIPFRRDVWALDFKFKPVRMIWVDVPQPSGYMQRKLIWYMVYSVTNTGKIMHPVEDVPLPYDTADNRQLYEVKSIDAPIRFAPEFLFEAHVRRPDNSVLTKVYPDRVIPVAMGPIRLREDPNRRFLTSVEMCRKLAVGETRWGVATWEDIDPKTFQFSIYVVGLTNSYRWKDAPGKVKRDTPIGAGRKLSRKILKLNFWSPGNHEDESSEEAIRFGIPGGVDYEWVYR